MQKLSAPEEMAELELALEKSRRVPGFRTLLVFFWGLILAKCLLAQWAGVVYAIPVNTLLFVLIPSFLISGAVTLGYAYWTFRELPQMPLSGRMVNATWAGCATGFGVLAVVAAGYDVFSVYLLPALAAVLLGIGCFIQSVVDRRLIFKIAATGWWVSALGLFTQPNINALAWMSLSLLLFVVLPAGWLYFRRHLPQ